MSLSTSPPKPTPKVPETPPPLSPKSPRSPRAAILPTVISSKTEHSQYTRASTTTTKYVETRSRGDDIRNKMKIPGLSALQQRVLSLNDDDTDNSFKSLTDFMTESKPSKPLTKSHSFKATKQLLEEERREANISPSYRTELGFRRDDHRISFTKAASLDSIKNLEEQSHQSELKFELKPVASDTVKTVCDTKTESSDNSNKLEPFMDSITISGPSHTAVVNVTSTSEDFTTSSAKSTSSECVLSDKDSSKTISIKENQVSVTKIQLKRETTQVTQSTVTVPKTSVPEFLNKQLNKVEVRPSSNIIFSMKSPRVVEEQNRPKTLFNFEPENDVSSKPPAPRKFSKENVEIVEKEEEEDPSKTSPVVSATSLNAQRFKKNGTRKPSVTSITPESPVKEKVPFKSKSASLDSLKSDATETESSQDSLDKLEEKPKEKIGSPVSETVVLRRKSVAAKKNDEEPELMKVFARRSLKLKDSDVDSIQDSLDCKTRDSDKENQAESPVDERKNSPQIRTRQENQVEKEPLSETKAPEVTKDSSPESPVPLRRTVNNNIYVGQRAVSVNVAKTTTPEVLAKKPSFTERRRTDQWITQFKNENEELKDKMQDGLIASDFITEPKNFNQRKAEWEKRAQQAQKKTTP